MRSVRYLSAFVLVGVLAAGCGRSDNPVPSSTEGQGSLNRTQCLLAQEPSGAKNVIDIRKEARDGDEVIVVGRIGGSAKPFTGRAAFTLVDLSLEPCDDDGCGNPWCSVDRDELKRATTLVKFVDGEGKTLADDVRPALGLKALQTVVVRGQVRREGAGLAVVASSLHVRP